MGSIRGTELLRPAEGEVEEPGRDWESRLMLAGAMLREWGWFLFLGGCVFAVCVLAAIYAIRG